MHKKTSFLIVLLLTGFLYVGFYRPVSAQDTTSATGSLVIKVPPGSGISPVGLEVSYSQISHDFLMGYAGPIPESGLPEEPYGFNLVLDCIPWGEIEPTAGNFPHAQEETVTGLASQPYRTTGNDCLLVFGEDGQNGLPDGVAQLTFDALLERTQVYLEHAVRYETSLGISLFVIKEPTYPSVTLQGLTASQWQKLVKLACQTIRAQAPRATIVIEIIPQYLPKLGYTPYTFLNNLILDGVSFDGIMMVFSRPVASYVSKTGYPHVNWVSSQVDIFSDLGKKMFVRFSGVPLVDLESDRQAWLEEMYTEIFNRQTVVGIYWDEVKLFPPKLYGAAWPAQPAVSTASADISTPLLTFISDRTTSGVIETDASGQAVIYGYAGDYEIRVDGIPGMVLAHIYRGEERRLDIVVPTSQTLPQNNQTGSSGQNETEPAGNDISTVTIVALVIATVVIVVLGVGLWKKERKGGPNKKDRG